MTLRTRSRLVALVSGLVFLVLLGLFLYAYWGKIQTQRDLALTESLGLAITQLRTTEPPMVLFSISDDKTRAGAAIPDRRTRRRVKTVTPSCIQRS